MARQVSKPYAYTPPRPMVAEGARIGFVICEVCGAALLLDPDDEVDRLQLHADWHERGNEDG